MVQASAALVEMVNGVLVERVCGVLVEEEQVCVAPHEPEQTKVCVRVQQMSEQVGVEW